MGQTGRFAADVGRTLTRAGAPYTEGAPADSEERPTRGAGFGAQDLFWIALAGSIAAFVLLVFRPNRDRIRAAEAECRLLRSEIESLEPNVTRLRGWERSLAADDVEAWSAVARRAGWVRPGETVMRSGSRPRGRVARNE
jgi:hypothetical protein